MSLEKKIVKIVFDFTAGDYGSRNLSKQEKILYNLELGCKAVRRAIKEYDYLRFILTCSTEKLSKSEFADMFSLAVYELADLVDNGKVNFFASEHIMGHGEDPIKAFDKSNTTTDAIRLLSGVSIEYPTNDKKKKRVERFKAHAVVSPGNTELIDYSVDKLIPDIKDKFPIIRCDDDMYGGIQIAVKALRPKIAIDTMTAENGVDAVLKGVKKALPKCDSEIILVGDKEILNEKMQKYRYRKLKDLKIIHSSEIVDMHEDPLTVSEKEDSSVVVAAKMVVNDKAYTFLSPGNTGASVMASMENIKLIRRGYPAIALLVPIKKQKQKYAIYLDAGARTNIKSMNAYKILQLAVEGAAYAKHVLNIKKPKVGILNTGEERWKGPEFLRESNDLLYDFAEESGFFEGYRNKEDCSFIESGTQGLVDVVVTDGYSGNKALKAFEDGITTTGEDIKYEASRDFIGRIGLVFLWHSLLKVKKKLRGHGGGHLLGVNKPTVILHGSTKPKDVRNAILLADKYPDVYKINKEMEKALGDLNTFYKKFKKSNQQFS